LFKRWRAEALLFEAATLVLVLDQLTKALVLRYLPFQVPWNPIAFLRPIVTLTHITNTGASFGLFPGTNAIFTAVAVVIIIAILLYYRHFPASQRLVRVSLGMQLGGALGNLLDRLFRGHVVDFIDFHFWPVFNVADSSIVIGVIILAYYLLFLVDKGEEESQEFELRSP